MADTDGKPDVYVARFVARARKRIHDATLADALSFLKVGDLAKGSRHAQFQKAFPRTEASPGGLAALIERIKLEAANAPDQSDQLDRDLLRLVKEAQSRSNKIGEDLRALAGREFDTRYTAGNDDLDWQIRALMAAVARSDSSVAKLLADRYRRTDELYAVRYEVLLTTLGRKPIPAMSYREFALTIGAVLNGFLSRAGIEGDNEKHVRDLFTEIIVPLIGAITYPVGSQPPSDESRIFGDTMASATEAHPRTPIRAEPLPITELADLVGTWQGRQHIDASVPNARADSTHRAYLVIDTSQGNLAITEYRDDRLSRMVTPTFVATPTGRRLSCMYETEGADNPRPDYPSYRGSLVLDVDSPATKLQGTYFNDRGSRGKVVSTRRTDQIADSYTTAQALFQQE
jgi:hypothetical protein